MRILFACPTFHIGGISSYALNLSCTLRSIGHWTIALVMEPYGELYESYCRDFDQVLVIRRHIETRSSYLSRVLELLIRLQPDVIINNGQPFIQAAFSYIPDNIIRLSVIHSIVESEIIEGVANERSVDQIIAVSQNVARAVQSVVRRENIVTTIPVGVSVRNDRSSGDIRQDVVRLFYVGRLSRVAKNLIMIERILDILYDSQVPFELTVVGDGDYRSEMECSLYKKEYRDKIRFLGAKTPFEIQQLLHTQDMLLLTSSYEGTPHSLLEAMAVGLVPICSRIEGSTDQIITDRVSGFLCETNTAAQYADAIKLLWKDRALFMQMSSEAEKRISESYAIDIITERYLLLIRDLASRRQVLSNGRECSRSWRFPQEMRPHCQSLARHLRHMVGAQYRAARGIRPIKVAREHIAK